MSTAESTLTLEALATRLGELERANSALREEHAREVADLKQEIARLRAERARDLEPENERPALTLPAWAQRNTKGRRPQTRPRTSRRELLQLGGATAAATVAAALLAAEGGTGTAHAAPGVPAIQGVFSDSGGPPAVIASGTSGSDGVDASSDTGTGVSGASTSGAGVLGTSSTNNGVVGIGPMGAGVFGNSTSGVGGIFLGGRAPLSLVPASGPGAPTSGFHGTGDLWLDSAGTLWLCSAAGTVGTWVRVGVVTNGAPGGGLSFLSTPVRLLETRPGFTDGVTNKGSPLANGTAFSFPVAGKGGIPSTASGVMGTITALAPSANGNLKFWPAGASQPNAVAVVAETVEGVIAGFTMSGLGSGGQVSIIFEGSSGSTCNVTFDAVGYTL